MKPELKFDSKVVAIGYRGFSDTTLTATLEVQDFGVQWKKEFQDIQFTLQIDLEPDEPLPNIGDTIELTIYSKK